MDGQIDGMYRNSPCVLQNFVPFGATAQKVEEQEEKEEEERKRGKQVLSWMNIL